MDKILCITVGILLPIIPAYIPYKTLPAKTTVSGPFKGLNIQLGGAFGGYFLLVLIALGYLWSQEGPSRVPYEIWKRNGQITMDQTPSATPFIQDVHITLQPPREQKYPGGNLITFSLDILVPIKETGTKDFPTLLIDHPLYESVSVPLSDLDYAVGPTYKQTYDEKEREIVVQEPILLKGG